MPLIVNGTNVEKVIYNGVELDKVICDGVTVWENIVHKTGQLTKMTSNTTPAPFVVTDWSSGAFNGDSSDKAWKVFGDGGYAKQANVAGYRCGAQLMFNTTAEIYPVKIYYSGGNHDAGGGGGGGHQLVEVCRPDGTWYEIGRHNDIGGGTITMDGKTRIIGIRMATVFGSGPVKWLEANNCDINEWYQKGNI